MITYDDFDDGLVHNHHWASLSAPNRDGNFPRADANNAQTPSTVYHDDHIIAG